jgi:tRNA(Arg) A34 adenosine deaminase TadA
MCSSIEAARIAVNSNGTVALPRRNRRQPVETFQIAHQELLGSPAPVTANPQLEHYWNLPVSKLCELEEPAKPRPEEKERHRLYSYLLMAIVHYYWNGYKRGRRGAYPWNDAPAADDPSYLDGEYRGHNIAALAVDGTGRILDLDFNHNTLFNSSAEHAEARLVRRLYSLAQIGDAWSAAPAPTYALGNPAATGGYTGLSNVTIYTSLESCSQCSGVMALAQIKEVVYLQTDPGMYFIGRILRNLTTANLRAPLPISGGEIDLRYFEILNASFSDFVNRVADEPFWISTDGNTRDSVHSVTSFLCTGIARSIFADGRDQLGRLANGDDKLTAPDFQPAPDALTNAGVVNDAQRFLHYARRSGLRGTPHNL